MGFNGVSIWDFVMMYSGYDHKIYHDYGYSDEVLDGNS